MAKFHVGQYVKLVTDQRIASRYSSIGLPSINRLLYNDYENKLIVRSIFGSGNRLQIYCDFLKDLVDDRRERFWYAEDMLEDLIDNRKQLGSRL